MAMEDHHRNKQGEEMKMKGIKIVRRFGTEVLLEEKM